MFCYDYSYPKYGDTRLFCIFFVLLFHCLHFFTINGFFNCRIVEIMKRTSYVNEGCKLAIYVKGGFNAIFG